MINVNELFKKYDIHLDSINRAVIELQDRIDKSSNPIMFANMITADFGGESSFHPTESRVIAKSLVVEALNHRDDYNPEKAMKAATARLEKMRVEMPWAFTLTESGEEASAEAQKKKRGTNQDGVDIKAKAFEIWQKHRDTQKASDIARVIAGDLNISYANAYYYVSRVFKKMQKKIG